MDAQRYKVGYYTDEWGMSSNTPCLVPDDSGYAVKFEDYCKLETELAAIKTELCEICAAIDDPACDLTLTTVECIKKLKAENESLKLDAERYRWLRDVMSKSIGGGVEVNDAALVYETSEPGEEVRVYWYPDTPIGFYDSKGSTLDEAIDEAMGKPND